MKWMGWSYLDLLSCPLPLRDVILDLMQDEEDERRRRDMEARMR